MKRNRWLSSGALLPILLFLFSACANSPPQDSLSPAGPIARKEDALFRLTFWIAVFVFVLVEGLIIVILYRFRHRPNSPVPVQVHGSKRLEIGWTIAPAVLLGVIAIPTLVTIFAVSARPAGANVLDVRVEGHQFWWHVDYPGLGITTANEVHIPAGVPVFITLESVDVIHSFWVPRLAGTQDLRPGTTTTLNIQADQPGVYLGQCKEYCGLSHANMRFRVVAQTQADFDAWVARQRTPAAPPPQEVLAIMQRSDISCGGCHTLKRVEGLAGQVGPDLTHFGGRATFGGAMFKNDPEKLRIWLHDAPAMKPGVDMPSFVGKLSDQDLDALIAYLESLK